MEHWILIGAVALCVILFCTTVHYMAKSFRLKRQADERAHTIADILGTTTAESNALKARVAQLEKQLNNQKSDIETLKEKGGKKDAVELNRYNRCAALIAKRIPGFYQTWAQCMEEVVAQESEENSGLKRIFSPIARLLSGEKSPNSEGAAPAAEPADEPNKRLDTSRPE